MIFKLNGVDFSDYVLAGGITFTPAPEHVSVKFMNGHTRASKLADLEHISVSFGLLDKATVDAMRAQLTNTYVTIQTDEGTRTYWDARLARRQRYILNGVTYYDSVTLSAKEA